MNAATPSLFIVTGSSRGLGRALVEQLLAPRHHVLGMARADDDDALAAQAHARGAQLEQWTQDLGRSVEAAQRLEHWLAALPATRFGRAVLINNAAVLPKPGPIDELPFATLSAALRLGLEAPLLLSAAFLRGTRGWRAERRLLHISSSLGRRAIAGGAIYGAVKAGLDQFSRGFALDEALKDNGARSVALAPGPVDTDMQRRMRDAEVGQVPEQPRFAALLAEGVLDTPHDAAAKVLDYLQRPDFGAQPVADIADA